MLAALPHALAAEHLGAARVVVRAAAGTGAAPQIGGHEEEREGRRERHAEPGEARAMTDRLGDDHVGLHPVTIPEPRPRPPACSARMAGRSSRKGARADRAQQTYICGVRRRGGPRLIGRRCRARAAAGSRSSVGGALVVVGLALALLAAGPARYALVYGPIAIGVAAIVAGAVRLSPPGAPGLPARPDPRRWIYGALDLIFGAVFVGVIAVGDPEPAALRARSTSGRCPRARSRWAPAR